MSKAISPYYPPRARWYSPVFAFGNALRRGLTLDRIHLPRGITVLGSAGSFLIPGLGVYLRGPRLWGKVAFAASGFLFLQFIVWLGHPLGNLAFGLLLSIHVTGFMYYCSPLLANTKFPSRLLFTILVLFAIGGLVYTPMRRAIQIHWLMPLRNGQQVIIVSVQSNPAILKRGDWAAFAGKDGILFGRIIGVGGDRVNSSTVPKNHWLIRTEFSRRYYEDGLFRTYSGRSDIIERTIIVSPEEFIGIPFKHWFWRKQILP